MLSSSIQGSKALQWPGELPWPLTSTVLRGFQYAVLLNGSCDSRNSLELTAHWTCALIYVPSLQFPKLILQVPYKIFHFECLAASKFKTVDCMTIIFFEVEHHSQNSDIFWNRIIPQKQLILTSFPLGNFLFCFFGPRQAIVSVYPCFCIQELLLAMFGGLYRVPEIVPRSASCSKASAILPIMSLQPNSVGNFFLTMNITHSCICHDIGLSP